MAVYSINDLEKLSGIKAHTIRVWESRYGLMQPQRTPTNIRYYDDDDLKFLLNIAFLNRNGYRISVIAKMDQKEITDKVAELSDVQLDEAVQLDALTIAMIEMDELKFDRIISANIKQLGFERTMIEVILPFLDKLGLLWLTGSIHPVQENFISYLIRQKLIVAIDQLAVPSDEAAEKFLIYLPEQEKQELSLLFVHYLLKARGKRVIYIGHDVRLYDVKDAYDIHQPDFIFTMITETYAKEPVNTYLEKLKEHFSEAEVLVTGYQVVVQDVQSSDNIHVLQNLEETLSFLTTFSKKNQNQI